MNWLIEHVPFPVQFVGGLAIIYVAWRFLGIRGAAGALAALAALFVFREGRKDGRASEATINRKEAAHAVKEATTARVDAARRDADPERLREDDGFRRD